jgi:hypothetical protein
MYILANQWRNLLLQSNKANGDKSFQAIWRFYKLAHKKSDSITGPDTD